MPTPILQVLGRFGKVYIGDGDMPDGYNVQINPNGLALVFGDDFTINEAGEIVLSGSGSSEPSLTEETDPTVPAWAKQSTKPTYTASEVGADKSGTAASAVSTHNTNTAAHNDIRLLIEGLTTRLNALANSDDTTLDQMAEVVAYIKANRDLIEQITTGKVSTSDIIDNLTTNVSTKPLSAAQGVALKALIDAITVPTKTSQLTNDSDYIQDGRDEPIRVGSIDQHTVIANGMISLYSSDDESTGVLITGLYDEDLLCDVLEFSGRQGLAVLRGICIPYDDYEAANKKYVDDKTTGKAETWTFTLEDGSTVTKKVVLA